jgi:hypothetical protein
MTSEKRHIVTAPRRSGPGAGKSRVVEVVHIRRDGAQPSSEQPRSVAWNVRVETWPDGFQAKPAQPLPPQYVEPVAPEPAQPVVHVMPAWEPSAPPEDIPAVVHVMPRWEPLPPRTPKAKAPKEAARRFADPFAEGEDGANCLRCGYLVEPARERRGLLTCAACS